VQGDQLRGSLLGRPSISNKVVPSPPRHHDRDCSLLSLCLAVLRGYNFRITRGLFLLRADFYAQREEKRQNLDFGPEV